MAKISDEIRKWCADLDSDDVLCTTETLYVLADRIDAELVELPKDRDGVPIHVGDVVYLDDGHETKVIAIRFNADHTTITCLMADNPSPIWCAHETLSHISPDSWERIADELDEMVDAADSADDRCEKLADLADRIRKLAKEQGDE